MAADIGKSQATVWKHIGLHGHSVGTLTADSSHIHWKSAVMGGSNDDDVSTYRTISARNIASAQWSVFGRSGYLRIQTKGSGNRHELRFDGFPQMDYDKLRDVFKKLYDVDVTKHAVSSCGASFGNTDIQGRNLVFRQCILEDADEEGEEFEPRDGDEMLSLDLAEVSQCVLPGNNRNEIELQFHESDTVEAGTDQLVAIRFYIPPDPDSDPNDKEASTSAELFQQRIMKMANIKNTTGNVIVEFDEAKGTFLTPRGRYTVELYDSFLRMRGNKYDYKIKYDDISRLFLLPKPDEVHMAFVIALDKPIRQGQQRYQYLVLQTTKEHAEVTVNLDEETLEKEYNGDLQPVMHGSLSNLVAKTFKVISRKKVFIPGKFANANQQACVKCALRANEGHLYPLEKQFLFIHKPAVLIRFDEVESVEFQRYAGGQGSTRNFDLCVTLKNTSGDLGGVREYIFSGIERSDYAGLYSFLSGKKIKIKNLQGTFLEEGPVGPATYNVEEVYGAAGDEEESSEDDDYNEKDAEESSSEDISGSEGEDLGSASDSDLEEARKKAAKEKKKEAKEKTKKQAEGEDNDDESSSKKRARTEESVDSSKKKKSKKDPNKPKKNLTSYMLFSQAKRAEIKEDNPDASFGDMAKLIGAEFKKLSPEERKKWDEKAMEEKKRYDKEMADYEPPSDAESDDAGSTTKKAKKDPNAPKKPMTSFMYFSASRRPEVKEENPDASFGDIAKIVGAEFKKLSADEKKKYINMAKEDKARYEKEMKDYVPPKGSDSGIGSTKKGGKAKKDPNAPKKAMTAFMYYSSHVRSKIKEKNPDATFGEIAKIIGEQFKKLSDEERKKYDDKAKADAARYKREMKAYQEKNKESSSKKKEKSESEDDDESEEEEDSDSGSSSDDDSDDGDSDDSESDSD